LPVFCHTHRLVVIRIGENLFGYIAGVANLLLYGVNSASDIHQQHVIGRYPAVYKAMII
jgi:hypothetical protein